jgi:hypothetical protein
MRVIAQAEKKASSDYHVKTSQAHGSVISRTGKGSSVAHTHLGVQGKWIHDKIQLNYFLYKNLNLLDHNNLHTRTHPM